MSRNLFFRLSSLTLMGVKLVFVMEGEAPKLKAETMSKRTQSRYGGFQKASAPKANANTSRGRFNAILREVCCCLTPHHRQAPLLMFVRNPPPSSLVCRDVGLPGYALGDSCWRGRGHVCLSGLTGSGGRLHHQRRRCLYIWGPDRLQKLQHE